jgi:hypothetical protein
VEQQQQQGAEESPDYHAEERDARQRLAELEERRRSTMLAVARGTGDRASLTEITTEMRAVEDQIRDLLDLQRLHAQIRDEEALRERVREYGTVVDAAAESFELARVEAQRIDELLDELAVVYARCKAGLGTGRVLKLAYAYSTRGHARLESWARRPGGLPDQISKRVRLALNLDPRYIGDRQEVRIEQEVARFARKFIEIARTAGPDSPRATDADEGRATDTDEGQDDE